MVKGLYTSYTGMLGEQKRLDIVSNNLANAATVGYKKESVTNQSFDDLYTIKVKDPSVGTNQTIGTMSLGVKIGEVYTDYTQGSLRTTGNTYDLALAGDGFFQVEVDTENGQAVYRYTRAGEFKLNAQGYVVDTQGNRLMGQDGPIQIPRNASQVTVDSLGNVYSNGEYLDQVSLTDFEDYNYLVKVGDTMYEAVEGAQEKAATGMVQQGYTEQSNVQSVQEMVDMIAITRAYEANQKAISTIDSMLEKAVNSIGSL